MMRQGWGPAAPLHTGGQTFFGDKLFIGSGSRAPREGDEWSVADKTIHPLARWPTTVGHAQANKGQQGNWKSEQHNAWASQAIDEEHGTPNPAKNALKPV